MTITINGDPREVESGATIADFLAAKGLKPQLVVVERNGEIAPRVRYAEIEILDGDTLEIVQMMAGG
jgi:thiamine biosynthesis protein ThiS